MQERHRPGGHGGEARALQRLSWCLFPFPSRPIPRGPVPRTRGPLLCALHGRLPVSPAVGHVPEHPLAPGRRVSAPVPGALWS